MVRVNCIMDFEFSNGKKTLIYKDIEFIEEWANENGIKINKLVYVDSKYMKSRRYSK
jgi:hypothetical protein